MNENKMGIMPVNKLLLTMAAPMVLSMLIRQLCMVSSLVPDFMC